MPVWKQSGPILSAGCANVGPSRAHVEPSGPSWAYIGPGWAYVGLCWAHLGPMLGLCWAHVGLCFGSYVGAMFGPSIYVKTILRCQFFLPGARVLAVRPSLVTKGI